MSVIDTRNDQMFPVLDAARIHAYLAQLSGPA
jgi:hypothetical protein